VIWVVAAAPVMAYAAQRWFLLFRCSFDFYRGWFCGAIGGAIGYAASGAWAAAAVCAASAILAAFLWWLSRRRRRKAPRSLGAKSRAVLAVLVRRAREAAKPRPVLRPVPGGVR
jgi:hypothetical protein